MSSWRTAGRTYARGSVPASACADLERACGCTIDGDATLVVRVRPVARPVPALLCRALLGEARPVAILHADVRADEIVVTLQPRAESLTLFVRLVDAVLVATPGRVIEPVFAFSDDVLAGYASERVGESNLNASRVLERYVERIGRLPGTDS